MDRGYFFLLIIHSHPAVLNKLRDKNVSKLRVNVD